MICYKHNFQDLLQLIVPTIRSPKHCNKIIHYKNVYDNQAQPESAIVKGSGLYKKNNKSFLVQPEHMMVGETKLFFVYVLYVLCRSSTIFSICEYV